jgi:hypothetical protein
MDLSHLDEHYHFEAQIVLTHKTVPLTAISMLLGREPTFGWSVGDPAPKGALTAIRRNTFWYFERQVTGIRRFTQEIESLLHLLQERREFVHWFQSVGGRVRIDVSLPGSINIGDEFSPKLLAQFSDLRVNLGIEVFPRMGWFEELGK